MSNIATVLRQEISRLSRKEIRSQFDPAKKTLSHQRRQIAHLKREVAGLRRELAVLSRMTRGAAPAAAAESSTSRVRFVAKGLRSQRKRLGLSAGDFGKLIGVSAQSVYNWEGGSAHPRKDQLAKLVALRGMGKREAGTRLARTASSGNKKKK